MIDKTSLKTYYFSAAVLLTSGTRGSRVNNLRRVGADGAQAGGGGARLQNKKYSIYNEER